MSATSAGARQVTHQALLEEAERQQSFYYYDTVAASGADLKHRTFRVDNPHEHRLMLAAILKHSRYYIANRSYVNKPEFTAGRDEISARFYEGAAAGTVMIGEAPRTRRIQTAVRLAGCGYPRAVRFSRYWPHPRGPECRPRAVASGSAQQCSGGRAQARLAASNSGRVRCPRPDADRKCRPARNGSTGSLHRHNEIPLSVMITSRARGDVPCAFSMQGHQRVNELPKHMVNEFVKLSRGRRMVH